MLNNTVYISLSKSEHKMRCFVLLLLLAVHYARAQNEDEEFVVPEPLIEVFKPRGLRVSIPDVPGIRLFAFHAKINEEMNGREGGTLSRDILKVKDGRWTFWDPNVKLKVGDVIYYWLYTDYFDGKNKLGYTLDDQTFVVNELQQMKQQKPKATTTTTTTTTTTPKPTTTRRPMVTTSRKPPCSVKSQTLINGANPCKGELLFEDNFSILDTKKWKTEIRLSTQPDYEFCIYTGFPENINIKNGNLHIKPTLSTLKYGEDFLESQINLGRNCTGIPGTNACSRQAESFQILPPVLSGRISTKEKFTFQYGRIEIRAKVPKGKWIYPIMYLQPKEFEYGLDYDSGQIRIAFVPGNEDSGRQLAGGIILSGTEDGRTYGMRYSQSESHWGETFHTYTLKWKPDGITMSVDGVAYGNVEVPEGGFGSEANNIGSSAGDRWAESGGIAPFDKEMYIALGVGVGGFSFPDGVGSKPWKNKSPKNTLTFWQAKDSWYPTWNDQSTFRIDTIKVYAL